MQQQNDPNAPKIRLKRALTVKDMYEAKFDSWELPDEWKRCIGQVSNNFSMIIWGNSGKGKTRFALMLIKILSEYGNVIMDCLEEGKSLTMQKAFQEMNMMDIMGKMLLVDREKYSTLVYRLKRKKSPKIVVINSLQHMRMTYEQWTELREKFRKKCFILISHCEGKEPAGAAAKSIRYDVDIKVHVQDYVAYPVSRFGGSTPFVIWPERAVIKPEWKNLCSNKNQKAVTSCH